MQALKRHAFIAFYLALTVAILYSFSGPMVFKHTTAGVIVGTVIATIGATLFAAIPAYLVAGGLAGILPVPRFIERFAMAVCHVLAGMPSIILGVVGFIVFSSWMKLGWSLLAAMLTLVLLLFPALVTAFVQLLKPVHRRYQELAQAQGIGPVEFLFRSVPRYKARELMELLAFGWTRALGDTAAVMLTCGALLDMPDSLFDSVRLLNYHIYLLAMDVPGGMGEARSLSFMVILCLFVLLFAPRLLINLHQSLHVRALAPATQKVFA